MTFDKAKEETYTLFDDRCRQLLSDFLQEKDKRVCSECTESCTQGQKIHKALRNLIDELTVEAAKRCDNRVDFFVCLLAPYLSSVHILQEFAQGKAPKRLAKAMARGYGKLMEIVKEGERESAELQRH